MKIENFTVNGFTFNARRVNITPTEFHVYYTSDKLGKTFSINNGENQWTKPFDTLYKMIKE